MNISESEFLTLSKKLLLYLSTKIEQQDKYGEIDVELQDGILKLQLGEDVFIINKQSAAKEIWLSSPISGPYHFSYNSDYWKTKNGVELISLLEQELNIKLNHVY